MKTRNLLIAGAAIAGITTIIVLVTGKKELTIAQQLLLAVQNSHSFAELTALLAQASQLYQSHAITYAEYTAIYNAYRANWEA